MSIFERPVELRPRVELRGYAVSRLWEDYLRQRRRSGSVGPAQPGRTSGKRPGVGPEPDVTASPTRRWPPCSRSAASHADAGYARQAAQAAFDLVDRLEQEQSLFIANSDVSRINHLSWGRARG